MNTFGENVKIARNRKKLTQEELGNKCKLGRHAIMSIENDVKIPRVDNASRIADALEVSIDDLIPKTWWRADKD